MHVTLTFVEIVGFPKLEKQDNKREACLKKVNHNHMKLNLLLPLYSDQNEDW